MNVLARRAPLAPLGLLFFLGCQAIAGLEDRQLPTASAGGGGQAGGAAGEGGAPGGASGAGAAGAAGTAGAAGPGGAAGLGGAGSGGVAGQAGSGVTLARPPKRPPGDPKPSTGSPFNKSFALKHIYYGTRTPEGDYDGEAWRKYGFDLDGKCTTNKNSINVCKQRPGVILNSEDYLDGDDCRDNSFGSVIFHTLGLYQKNFEINLNKDVEVNGASTFLLEIEDIDGPDDPYAPANLYLAAYTPKVPLNWEDGNGERFIDISSADLEFEGKVYKGADRDHLLDGDVLKPNVKIVPQLRFARGYVSGGTWVSGNFTEKDGVLVGEPADSFLTLGSVTIPEHLELMAMTLHFKDPQNMSTSTIDESQMGAILSLASINNALNKSVGVIACNSAVSAILMSAQTPPFDPAADLLALPPYNDNGRPLG